jgi:riboflavin kinase / FMN adenylyltransferase
MKAYSHYTELKAGIAKPRVVTIGNFDGVHLGHQAVLAAARRLADDHDLELAVLTFEPHPAELLKPDSPRLRLASPERKIGLLGQYGVDLTLAQSFNEEFAALTAQDFTSVVLADALCAKQVLVGENFRFGRARVGDVTMLKQLGKDLGFSVSGEPLVQSGTAEISSSRVRRLLIEGNVAGARDLLGRCHEIPGIVRPDRGLGSDLGFPTINLNEIEVLVPAPGIYAGRCDIGGEKVLAAIYLGNRPTVNAGYSVEAHLLDFKGDLYDRPVCLELVDRVRGDRKLDGIEALTAQITKDIVKIRKLLEADHE